MPFIGFTGTPLFKQDVECLSTLYIDKPMKAHTLMQAIARANRVYPGKNFGLIVDYDGMLRSLRGRWRNMRWAMKSAARKRSSLRPRRPQTLYSARASHCA